LVAIIGGVVLVLALGMWALRAGGVETLADEPPISISSAWPPIHRNLSASPEKHSKGGQVAANGNGILAVWSEGDGGPTGEIRMAWYNRADWDVRRVDDQGGYTSFSPRAALDGTMAHFVWVGTGTGGDVVWYRSRNLSSEQWSRTEQVYPANGTSGDSLGSARIAIDSTGTPHVIWTRKYVVDPEQPDKARERIFYSRREGAGWTAAERISGLKNNDLPEYAQDMPAIAVDGDDVYVSWRERAKGDGTRGIYVRHLDPSTLTWQPEGDPWGQRLSSHSLDEFPTLAAAGDRLYVAWDRWAGEDCPGENNVNCYQEYWMMYRVMTGTDITTDWWPAGAPNEDPAAYVADGEGPIAGSSYLSTTLNPQTGEPNFYPGDVPVPDDYYSGVRPKIAVVEAGGVYTPYLVWHHWENGEHLYPEPGAGAPYQVRYTFVGYGDLDTAEWEDAETLTAMGSDGSFASPLFALTTGVQRPYDLHVILNVQLGEEDPPWDVAYTNLDQFYWVYQPLVLRGY
jgi:hypothetical protein